MTDPRRALPSVDALLLDEAFRELQETYGRDRVVDGLRRALDAARVSLRADPAGPADGDLTAPSRWRQEVEAALAAEDVPSLRRVVNATGVVLHTNLGRAPLAVAARLAMARAAEGYANLEYDLETGARGSRYVHCADLLARLSGAEDALVVNNAAGAVVLALNTMAVGRGVAVSRGELVEIGGGFRIPEIMERSGARLVEVGATNRTRIGDFRRAVDVGGVAALLKVHRSNFRMSGFTEEASLADMVALGRDAGLPVLHDLGSGLFMDPAALGLPAEPTAAESVALGADLVVVSGDKLFGGPQAGIVMGRATFVAALRANPLCRALRVDKVTLAGLEATARLYRDPPRALREIPTLRMLSESAEGVGERARALCEALRSAGIEAEVVPTLGAVGGGTYPDVELPSFAVALTPPAGASQVAARLRRCATPVVGRIEDQRLLLDLRTVTPDEAGTLVHAVALALEVGG